MKNCTSCGGDLISIGNNYRYCTYCGNVYGQDDTAEAKPIDKKRLKQFDTGVNVFDDNINSVLEIRWFDGQCLHSGSGFIISPDGYAVTNTHVVTTESGDSCNIVNVSFGDTSTEAEVIKLGDNKHGLGSGIDLALIKIKNFNGKKSVRFADFNNVKIGEQVFVIGNSLGYGTCITSGIVSDKKREVNGKMLLMTDCAINGGNSGGPMFNTKGEVIAVIVSGINGAEGMNFAIPVDDVISFINGCDRKIDITQCSYGPFSGGNTSTSCPRCGSRTINCENGIYRCFSCDYEW